MDNASAIAEIKAKLPIVDLIQQRVSLMKSGHNYKGLCPFHGEKTPSFYVFTEGTGSYHCFGCKESGDIFNFVMKTQGLDFGDALKELAARAGVQLETRQGSSEEDRRKERLRQLNQAAADYFYDTLLRSPAAEKARAYALERGVNQSGLMMFHLGYALDSWDALLTHLRGLQYSDEEMLAAGLVIERDGGGVYDRFRNRLIFPIRDAQGRIVGFGGRTLDKNVQPKYMNTPQTALFDKSSILFGLDLARDNIRKANEAIIVEGYLDALIAHQSGIGNVVAGMGTAVGEKQITQLKKLTANITLALDADAAGDMAALREAELLRQSMDHIAIPVYSARGLLGYEYKLQASIKIAMLPEGEDPDDVIRRNPDEWRQIIARALPVVEHYLSLLAKKHDLSAPRGKREAVEQMAPLIASVGDAVERAAYYGRLAKVVGVDPESVKQTVESYVKTNKARVTGREVVTLNSAEYRQAVPRPAATTKSRLDVEEALLSLLLRYPALRDDPDMPDITELAGTQARLLYSTMLNYSAAELEKDSGVDRATNRLPNLPKSGKDIDDAGIIDDDDPNLPYPLLRQALDPALRGFLLHLLQIFGDEPVLMGRELINELAARVRRLRQRRDRFWLKRTEQLLKDLQESGERDEVAYVQMLVEVSSRLEQLRRYAPPRSPLFRDSRDPVGNHG